MYFFAFVSHMAQCKRIVPKIVLLPMVKKEDAFFQDATISNSRMNTKNNGSQSNKSRDSRSPSMVKTKRASGISMNDLKMTIDKRLPTNLYKSKDKIFLHMPEDGIVVAKTLGDFSRSDYSDLMPGKECKRMTDISARDIYLCILARDEDADNSDWDSNATAREIVQAIKDQFKSDRLDIPPPFTFRNLFTQWKRIPNLIDDGIVIKFSIPKGWRIVCKRLLKLICDSDLIYLEYDKFTLWELFQLFKQETLSKRINFNYEKIEAVVHMYQAIHAVQPELTDTQKEKWLQLKDDSTVAAAPTILSSVAPPAPTQMVTPTNTNIDINTTTIQQKQLQQQQQQIQQQQQQIQQLLNNQRQVNQAGTANNISSLLSYLQQQAAGGAPNPLMNMHNLPNNLNIPLATQLATLLPSINTSNLNTNAYVPPLPSLQPTAPTPNPTLAVATTQDAERTVKKRRVVKPEANTTTTSQSNNLAPSKFSVTVCERANMKQKETKTINEFELDF